MSPPAPLHERASSLDQLNSTHKSQPGPKRSTFAIFRLFSLPTDACSINASATQPLTSTALRHSNRTRSGSPHCR
ncbi:hypothetical protein VTK26DRAFT_2199 [Humicola hyalothermophila]